MVNRPVRVLLVGRRFWPHGCHDSAGFLIELACGLRRRGIEVEVLTPRYDSSWPEKFWLREVPVHRPAAAPRSEWSMGRYVRQLTSWLRARGGAYDVVWTDTIREEATAVIDAAPSAGYASVLRHSGHSDAAWWQSSRAAARAAASAARRADRIVVATAAGHRGLLTRGIVPEKVVRIDNGFAAATSSHGSAKTASRKALAAINGDLSAAADCPVLLCVGRMTPGSGMQRVVENAYHWVTRYPNLRLWLIGDGPGRDAFYTRLRSDGLRASFAMPGSFANLSDVMTAADLFVQTDEDGLEFFLPSAVTAELPLVVIDTEATREVFGASEAAERVEWFAEGPRANLREAVARVLDDLAGRREAAAALRRLMLRRQPQSETVEQYVRLFTQMRRPSPATGGGPSIEAAS